MAIPTCVLVHGGWHGGWHWDDVSQRLRSAGVRVFAPTLRGLAERSDEATETTSLADHVDDVVDVLDRNDLRDVVLVGHSYGGAVITGAAHARPERIAQVVYLDAFVLEDGQSLADVFGPQFVADARERARAAGTPHLVPPAFAMEDVLGVGSDEAAAHASRLSSHPIGTMLDALVAKGAIPATRHYIRCSANSLGMFDAYAERARRSPDWHYYELPSPHDAVYAMPAIVAGVLQHVAVGRAGPSRANERVEVLRADKMFFDALLAHDAAELDRLLAADFVIVDVAAGGVTTRADFVAAVQARAVKFDAIATDPTEALVRIHGTTGIVVGATTMRLRLAMEGDAEVCVHSRYTHVFELADDQRWRLASAQGTPIR